LFRVLPHPILLICTHRSRPNGVPPGNLLPAERMGAICPPWHLTGCGSPWYDPLLFSRCLVRSFPSPALAHVCHPCLYQGFWYPCPV